MLTIGQESSQPIEIDAGGQVRAVTFSANGEYIVSGDDKNVQVWRVDDQKQLAKIETGTVNCVAVSNDGKWIAAGTWRGDVFIWDAATFRLAIKHSEDEGILGVDFPPDSRRLVSVTYKKAAIRDLATGEQVQILRHEDYVRAAKYSPQGDRIATATGRSVQVWDGNDGQLLVDIKVKVTPWRNTGLLWFNDHLLAVSDNRIKKFNAYTGSTVSESLAPNSNDRSCIALPKHRAFIAYSTDHTTAFWDTSTPSQLALIQHPQNIQSIALSPDDHFIAIGREDGKITIKSVSRIIVSVLSRWIRHVRATLRVFPHRIPSHGLIYIQLFKNRTSISIAFRSTHGNMTNSRTQTCY